MTKIETNADITAVEVTTLPNGKTRIALHKNIAVETRTDEEGSTYTVNTADESVLLTDTDYTAENAEAEFDELLVLAETGKTSAQYYADRVNEIVRESYSQSAVEAILNNYLTDSENAEIKAEFEALQECRAQAKVTANAELAAIVE